MFAKMKHKISRTQTANADFSTAVVSPMKLEDCLGLSFKTVSSGSFGQRQANETPTVVDESSCN